MSKGLLSLFLCLGCVLVVRADPSSVIRVGEAWRFLKTADSGVSPGVGWRRLGFDDAQWRMADSGLVVPEDDDEPVVRRAAAEPGWAYLRKKFTVSKPGDIHYLLLRVEHEAGFVAYLNGVEIARRSGKGIHFPTAAETASGIEDASVFGVAVDVTQFASLLVPGDNLLALEGASTGESLAPFPISAALAANFTRGPFLQSMTPTGVQIIWRTGLPGSSFVDYGRTAALGSVVTNGESVVNHVVGLTGLQPETTYYYRVGSAMEADVLRGSVESFRTFKTAGPIKFLLVGDTGQASVAQGHIAAVMRNSQPDLVLHGGDILYSAPWTEENADMRIFNYYQQQMKTTPFYFAIGNHDLGCCFPETVDLDIYSWPSNAMNFQRTFYLPTNSLTGTEHFYSFDQGDVHFVALYNPWFSAYVFPADTTQYRWLTNDLASSTKPWKFLFMHSPIAHSGQHATADRGTPLAPFNGILDQTEMMNLLLPAAQRYGVQLVFGSHEHSFERFAPTNGMHSVVSGGGGANNSSYGLTLRHMASAQFWLNYHYLRVSVEENTARIQAFGTNGAAFDSLVIQRTLPPAQIYPATWNTPVIETTPANDGDGNITGQTFDLVGTPILPRHGQFSNLGEVYVNNDETNLYVGLRQAMYYGNNNLFLFVESPRQPGVTNLVGLGNGLVDPAGQGADGLDFLENLSFTNFTPSVGCILGDEYADGQFRSFTRGNLALNVGQGIFRLDAALSDVPGARLQQFNRSPQSGPVANDANADLIELAIPFESLGGVQPGDIIKLGAVVGGSVFNSVAQTRFLDTAALAAFVSGSGLDPVLLEGVRVRLAFPPALDTDGDGLPDNWELAHGLDPHLAQGSNGASGDPDGDGVTNLQEYTAGTDPMDPRSYLKVDAISAASGLVTLQFVAGPDRTYGVQWKQSVNAGVWQSFTNVSGGEISQTITVTDPQPPVSGRIYRLITPP